MYGHAVQFGIPDYSARRAAVRARNPPDAEPTGFAESPELNIARTGGAEGKAWVAALGDKLLMDEVAPYCASRRGDVWLNRCR